MLLNLEFTFPISVILWISRAYFKLFPGFIECNNKITKQILLSKYQKITITIVHARKMGANNILRTLMYSYAKSYVERM